ncbi:MAG: preprotein translocase subunit YajC [Elusimicrobia bacterium]|nr:preprotein translocase subunit YajC [Elusimicrobiota bacterium]
MQNQPNPIVSLIPIIAIFLIFYFLLIRPQQKEADVHKKMLEGLKKGDRIVTNGGFYGTIVTLKGDDLEVRFSDNVKLLMARSAVSRLLSAPAEGGAEAAGMKKIEGGAS